MALTAKQQAYVAARVAGSGPAEAYRLAYDAENMSPATIANEANELEKHPKIAPLIAKANEKALERIQVTANMIVERAWDIATYRPNGPAVMALSLLAKRFPEFRENQPPPNQTLILSGLSDEQLEAAIEKLAGGRP